MNKDATMLIVLQELREFRKETNERFDLMEKRITKLEEKVDKLDQIVGRLEEKVDKLEEGRKIDRREILDVLDTMQKSISKQFVELKDYIDMHVERFNVTSAANDVEHAQFRQLLKAYGIKIDIQDCRVKYLEKWRKGFRESDFVADF